jgi:hypothetical protein
MHAIGIIIETFEEQLMKRIRRRVNQTVIGNQLLVIIWVAQNQTRIGFQFQNHH